MGQATKKERVHRGTIPSRSLFPVEDVEIISRGTIIVRGIDLLNTKINIRTTPTNPMNQRKIILAIIFLPTILASCTYNHNSSTAWEMELFNMKNAHEQDNLNSILFKCDYCQRPFF